MSFAKVQIVGNLGRDPEVRYTPNGTMNVQFSIAASGRRRSGGDQGGDQDNTTWFRVTAWDRNAERIVNMMERGYIGKGKMLFVDGTLESRQYQGNDGQMRTSLDVTLTDWQFVGSRQDSQGGGGFRGQGQGQNQGGGYGGSNYGNNYGGGQNQPDFDMDDQNPSDLNDVPF